MGKKWFCPCSGCEYTAGSKKDVCRHLCSRKHEKEPIGRLLRSLRNYKCIFPNCKSRSKTFSRRDNFKRHMADVHNVQLPQLNSGRPAKVSARSVLMGHGEE
ncbi:hypothetical protein F5Y10DRAFT_259281 [Nemania abortiva]|nr:hypothetical protein F5Y10DRAFT_259281 [Nemania abortiva]